MKRSGMKEQNVPRVQFGVNPLIQYWLVFRQVAPEKEGIVKRAAGIILPMRTGNQLQTPVLSPLRTERQPDTDQIGAGKSPVADILMPSGIAAEPGLLGHNAIVMRQRADHLLAENLLEPLKNSGMNQPLHEGKIAAGGLFQAPHGFAPLLVHCSRGTGVL
jgi:hypothetical protein